MMHVKHAFRILNRFWTILNVAHERASGVEQLRMRRDAFAGAGGHRMWWPLLAVCCKCWRTLNNGRKSVADAIAVVDADVK